MLCLAGMNPNPQVPKSGARPLRVLLADDNEAIRRPLSLLLRREGYEVTEVADVPEFVGYLASLDSMEDQVDLVISDVWMPSGSGADLLGSLRGMAWRVPVILMTASHNGEVRAAAEQHGAVLLEKPFPLMKILAICRQLVPACQYKVEEVAPPPAPSTSPTLVAMVRDSLL